MLCVKTCSSSSLAFWVSKKALSQYKFVGQIRFPVKNLVNKPLATFWEPKGPKPSNKSQEESALVVRSDGTLRRSYDYDSIRDFGDKFGLSKITDIKKVFALLKQANYNYPLNDLVHFLRRVAELNDQYMLKLDKHNSTDLETLVRHIKSHLKNATQEYPHIGSIANCFWRLGYRKDQELWLTLGDYIIDDRYHPNFNESVYGLEGFTVLKKFADKEFIDKVYERLEWTASVTMWEVNMTYYQRIAKSLAEVERYTPKIFEKLEYHVLRNLDMEYELSTMIDILFSFAKSGQGSKSFYHVLQFVIHKGHGFRGWGLNFARSLTPSDSFFVARLCEVYRRAIEMHPELTLEADFKAMVYNLVTGKRANYNLENLVQVLENIDSFQFEEIDDITKTLDKRLFEIDENMNAHDMIRYIDITAHRNYEGDYEKIPKKVLVFFDSYLKKNLMSQDPRGLYYYVFDIEARGLIHQYDTQEFMNKLVEYVGTKLNSYDFEDMCYYFWLFNKYNHLIDMENKHVQHNMNLIKDNIRLHSAFSKGRLMIGSNFYKMLEVVTGSDFLTQGEYPDW